MKIRNIKSLMGDDEVRRVETVSSVNELPEDFKEVKLYKAADTGKYYLAYKDVYLESESIEGIYYLWCAQYLVDTSNNFKETLVNVIHTVNSLIVPPEVEAKNKSVEESKKKDSKKSKKSDEQK